jgi:ketosteroid isomerase-like protein
MSQENVELCARGFAAMNRQDLDAFLELMDRQVEGIPRLAAMEGVYHGHGGILRWWNALFGAFPDLTFELGETRDLGDLTFTPVRLSGRGSGSGAPVDEAIWHLAWWEDGKCTRWGIYNTEEEALDAARSIEVMGRPGFEPGTDGL